MTDEISVNFEAKNPSGIKLLNRLYNEHLVLNDIGVRLNDQLTNGEDLTVPNAEDMNNLSASFSKAVQTFTDITDVYGDVDNFAENFGGDTKEFAQKLIVEMVDFNNGIADIGDTPGGLENYDDDKLNKWVNLMMDHIIDTNGSFNKLIKNN